MIRVFCSTNTCTLQRAQLHHAAQREATLRAQLAAVTAERDAAIAQAAELAADNARLRAELDAAREGAAFYMGLFAEGVTR